MIPSGVAGDEARPAEHEQPGVHRVEAVDVFVGSTASRAPSRPSAAEAALDEDAVDRVVGVQLPHELEQLLLGRVRREPVVDRAGCRPRPPALCLSVM